MVLRPFRRVDSGFLSKGTKVKVYRVQPVGLELSSHRSETSIGELDRGVHVCHCVEELQGAVNGWCRQDYVPEVVVIECDERDVRENGDYEGSVLIGNRGRIVNRVSFASWDTFSEVCRGYGLSIG